MGAPAYAMLAFFVGILFLPAALIRALGPAKAPQHQPTEGELE